MDSWTEIKAMFYGIKKIKYEMVCKIEPLGEVILLEEKYCSYFKNVFLLLLGCTRLLADLSDSTLGY